LARVFLAKGKIVEELVVIKFPKLRKVKNAGVQHRYDAAGSG
jgi:hypothetical protein